MTGNEMTAGGKLTAAGGKPTGKRGNLDHRA
jgi:hypothetical protein